MNTEQTAIYRYLVDQLLGGRLSVGDRLPTENELGERFSTTRMNAHFAIKQLEAREIVARKKRVGTEVIKEITPALARQLKGESNRKICVVTRSDEDYGHIHWNDTTLSGLEPSLIQANIDINYRDFASVHDRATLITKMQEIAAEGFSGLVLVMGNWIHDKAYTENVDVLYQYFKNIYVYLRDSSQAALLPFHTVAVSNFYEGALATTYFYDKGHRSMAFYAPEPADQDWHAERFKGAAAALLRHSDGECHLEELYGLEAVSSHLSSLPADKTPYPIIANHDASAAELIDTLTQAGFERGKDYLILGFDNNSTFESYQLTTVAPPLEKIGSELARLIVESIDIDAPNDSITSTKIHSSILERSP